MRCLKITDTRTFMAALFTKPLLDQFFVEEIQIVTAYTVHLNGRSVPAFYTEEELNDMPDGLPEFAFWEQLRPICFSIIKGKKTPVSFNLTLHAPAAISDTLCAREECTVQKEQVQALTCSIRYADGICRIVNGTSFKTFLPDKSLDKLWDEKLCAFLSEAGIAFEEEL